MTNMGIVDEYIALPIHEQGSSDVLKRVFRTIEYSFSDWNELKGEYDKLPRGILKAMLVILLARVASSEEELKATLALCNRHNRGPVKLINQRLKKEFNV